MLVLVLILVFMRQFEDISAGSSVLYRRAGDAVDLPCFSAAPSYTCSSISWFHRRSSASQVQVTPAARMSLNSKCSLVMDNITAEDAGLYTCLFEGRVVFDVYVYLSVLTVSPSEPPAENGDVTLKCFLSRHPDVLCPEDSLQWVNETGTGLMSEDCLSYLTVQHQSGRNQTVFCRFVEADRVKIEAPYTVLSTEDPLNSEGSALQTRSPLVFIAWTLRIAILVLMMGLTVGLVRTRRSLTPPKDMDVQHDSDHSEIYENSEDGRQR